ncbi:unnamed protein product [Boreogadus saida]
MTFLLQSVRTKILSKAEEEQKLQMSNQINSSIQMSGLTPPSDDSGENTFLRLVRIGSDGTPGRIQGKTLDDISIDPGENVLIDSDTEVVCQLDSQESEVTSSQREENETAMPNVSDGDAAQQQGTTTPPQASHRQLPKKQEVASFQEKDVGEKRRSLLSRST